MAKLVFLDTETTGLDSNRHEIWELAFILVDDGPPEEYAWQFPVSLDTADPTALRFNRFYERRWPMMGIMNDNPGLVTRSRSVKGKWVSGNPVSYHIGTVAKLLDQAHIVGAVPNFDEPFLAQLLRKHGHAPTWHYHLIDIESMAVGWLYGRFNLAATKPGSLTPETLPPDLPWKSDELSRLCGVEPPSDEERHTALGDAWWVYRWHQKLTGSEV